MHKLTKLIRRIFNRFTIVIILLAVQLGYFISLIWNIGNSYTNTYFIFLALSFAVSLVIAAGNKNPSYKLAWILPILVFPLFGGLFYLFFGGAMGDKRIKKKLDAYHEKERQLLVQNDNLIKKIYDESPTSAGQYKCLYRCSGAPVYMGTQTTYLESGEKKLAVLLEKLEKAEKFIFLEYFIIGEGVMWGSILEILKKKAAQGVDIRVIYDDFGCMMTLPPNYDAQLEQMGIKCRIFNKFSPIFSIKMNNRDHRKILIIDGNIAFTGGINLADEYINRRLRFGHWKDSSIMLEGEAVWSFTVMFLTMWDFVYGKDEPDYYKFRPTVKMPDDGFAAPFTDSPLDNEEVGRYTYLNVISKSSDYLYITTPYLVLDNETLNALVLAARNGVDVRIITPFVPDKKFVHQTTKAYYKELIKRGVKIYEYSPGFIHSKTMISDDKIGVVGTINLDYRSLFLHFECAVLMHGTHSLIDLKQDFEETLSKCTEITYADCINISPLTKLYRAFLRLLAPLI